MLETNKKQSIVIKLDPVREFLYNLFQDKLFLIVTLCLFVKSILFLGLLPTPKATSINLSAAFYSVPQYLLYLNFIIVFLAFSFLFGGRKHGWSLIVIDFILTVLFISDLWYYRGFSGFLNFFLLSQTSNLDNLGSSVLSMFRAIDIIFVLDILFLFIYLNWNREVYRGVKRSIPMFLGTFILPVLYITYAHYKVDVYDKGFSSQSVFYQVWAPNETMSNLGPVGYHIFDAYKYYKYSKPYTLSEQDKKEINSWYKENRENLPDNQYAGMFKGKNLLVIQWESLENFVVGQKIQGQEITPNLNRLLEHGLYFRNYHENVNNGTSSDADLLTNTGVYPVREGSTFFRYPNNTYKASMPKLMEELGYTTLAIHPDKGSYWNWKPSLQSIGFQKCLDSNAFESKEPIGLGLADKEFLTQVAPIVEKEKQPFFTFLVTLTSHSPFELPEKFKEMKLEGDFDKNILGNYFQSLHYTDTALGKFLGELDTKGILKDTVVVVYGDHTGVHKYYPDKVNDVRPSEDWWMDNDKRIPLIIYNPSVKGEVFDIQGGQIDLLPTVAYIMGAGKDKFQNDALGKILVNTDKKYTILNNYKMYGDYTPEDEKHARDGIMLSDKMVQSNYFKGN